MKVAAVAASLKPAPLRADDKGMSAQENENTAGNVTGRRCRHCGYGEVTPVAIEAYASGDNLAGDLMREALVRRGVVIAEIKDVRNQCPSCESAEVVDYSWKLDADGRVVPATTAPLKETG